MCGKVFVTDTPLTGHLQIHTTLMGDTGGYDRGIASSQTYAIVLHKPLLFSGHTEAERDSYKTTLASSSPHHRSTQTD